MSGSPNRSDQPPAQGTTTNSSVVDDSVTDYVNLLRSGQFAAAGSLAAGINIPQQPLQQQPQWQLGGNATLADIYAMNNPAQIPVAYTNNLAYGGSALSGAAAMQYILNQQNMFASHPTLESPDIQNAYKLLFMEKFQQKLSDRFTDQALAVQGNLGHSQQQLFHWRQVLDNYAHQNRHLVENTRQLLDAQIEYQRNVVQNQLAVVNEILNQNLDGIAASTRQKTGVVTQAEAEEETESVDRKAHRKGNNAEAGENVDSVSPSTTLAPSLSAPPAASHTKTTARTKKTVVQRGEDSKRSASEGLVALKASAAPAVSSKRKRLALPLKKYRTSSESGTGGSEEILTERPEKTLKVAPPESKVLPPPEPLTPRFPVNYEVFIQEIALDPQIENIIQKFNKLIDGATDESLAAAVEEDKEIIQGDRHAKRSFYEEQIEAMNTRMEMYSKLEEAVDNIIVENSARSQSKGRSLFKAHIREVAMDLLHIGLNDYQMLEDNMDNVLGVSNP